MAGISDRSAGERLDSGRVLSLIERLRKYLREQPPYNGERIEGGDMTIDPQDMRMIGPAPDRLVITAALLEAGALPGVMSFAEGVLMLNLLPAVRHYRPLYWDDYDMVAFERIDP